MKLPKFALYAAVGASGTAVQYAVLLCLVRLGGVGTVSASTAGAIAGAIVNYVLNYRFTFNSDGRHTSVAPKFFAVAIMGVAANWLAMTFMVHALQLNYLMAQVASSAIVLLVTYTVNSAGSFNVRMNKS